MEGVPLAMGSVSGIVLAGGWSLVERGGIVGDGLWAEEKEGGRDGC